MEKESSYKLSKQPFEKKHEGKLPLGYYLFRSIGTSSFKDRFGVSSLHKTDRYPVGNIYRPISNIV